MSSQRMHYLGGSPGEYSVGTCHCALATFDLRGAACRHPPALLKCVGIREECSDVALAVEVQKANAPAQMRTRPPPALPSHASARPDAADPKLGCQRKSRL